VTSSFTIDDRGVVSDWGRQMQWMEDDLGSFVFLYTSIFFGELYWVWHARSPKQNHIYVRVWEPV